jgi:hypothetical protein
VTVKQLVAGESLQWLHCDDCYSVAVCVGGSNTAKVVFTCCKVGGRGKNRFVIVQIGRRGLGWHSQYSDAQWCGQSRDQILVAARFSAPIHNGPEAFPAIYTMGTVCLCERIRQSVKALGKETKCIHTNAAGNSPSY